MKELDLQSDVKFVNAVALEKTITGIIPLRFGSGSLARFGNMVPIARMGTGIEMQIGGGFKEIEVTARCCFDDGFGTTAEWFWGPHKHLPTVTFEPGKREVKTFSVQFWNELPDTYPARLIFPTHCEIEILKVRVNAGATVQANFPTFDCRQMPGANGLRYLVHGDSITQGASVSLPTMTWPDLVARNLGMKVTNLGIGSHGKAELAMAEDLAAREDFDILSLHIGTNGLGDKPFLERLRTFLEVVLGAHSDKIVTLASPILCLDARREENPLLAPGRRAMAAIAAEFQVEYPKFYFIPGENLLSRPDSLTADFVHISDQGAMDYAENMTRILRNILERDEQFHPWNGMGGEAGVSLARNSHSDAERICDPESFTCEQSFPQQTTKIS